MSDLIDSRMGMLQTITQPSRDQLLRAQAWAERMTDNPHEVREIMEMLAGNPRKNVFSGNNRRVV